MADSLLRFHRAMPNPVTIGDLKRDGKLLEIGCLGCGRHVYVDAASCGLPQSLPVPNAAARLVCSACGARNRPVPDPRIGLSCPIYARPDARAPGVL